MECSCANNKVVPVEAYDDVLEAARQYVDGLRAGDADTVAKAFHKEAVMYGHCKKPLMWIHLTLF